MTEPVVSGWEEIANLLASASISNEEKGKAVWCLQKLPGLGEAFSQSYESRYAEEIFRLERAMLTSWSNQAAHHRKRKC